MTPDQEGGMKVRMITLASLIGVTALAAGVGCQQLFRSVRSTVAEALDRHPEIGGVDFAVLHSM